MEAQRIVVNGRNLPVHRFIELQHEEQSQIPTNTTPFVPSPDAMKYGSPNPQDVPYDALALSKESTELTAESNDHAGSSDTSPKKNFFNPPERVAKVGKKSKQPFKNKDAFNQLKQRYKTELCRHYKRSGYCPLESYCQFAHGNHELRRPSDPLPGSFGNTALGAVHSNYKTSACRNWAKTGQCKFGATCSFFHDPSERRKLTDPLPNMPAGLTVPPQVNKVYVEKADMDANCSFDFGAFNSFSQQMYGAPGQQLNGLDELAATGGFNPNKYMAPMPMPHGSAQPSVMPLPVQIKTNNN